MNPPAPRSQCTSLVTAIVRVIQFRSELAIVMVLGSGIAVGAVARQILPVSAAPSATFAAPAQPASRPPENRRRAPAPARPSVPAAQVVDR